MFLLCKRLGTVGFDNQLYISNHTFLVEYLNIKVSTQLSVLFLKIILDYLDV